MEKLNNGKIFLFSLMCIFVGKVNLDIYGIVWLMRLFIDSIFCGQLLDLLSNFGLHDFYFTWITSQMYLFCFDPYMVVLGLIPVILGIISGQVWSPTVVYHKSNPGWSCKANSNIIYYFSGPHFKLFSTIIFSKYKPKTLSCNLTESMGAISFLQLEVNS